jgi:hypothetical protein
MEGWRDSDNYRIGEAYNNSVAASIAGALGVVMDQTPPLGFYIGD